MILLILLLIFSLITVGGLVYVCLTVRHISHQADLLVNVALPWFNSIGQVVIPDFKTIPIPMWKGP